MLIVGSGFGGATAAYALSRAGFRVLLVERGGWPHRDETDWNGRAILLEGRYRGETPLLVRQEGATEAVETFPNEVVGGNSIFFGGATLRLRTTDFARWPISYADLEPHYADAEALLEVHGRAGDDPCEPPRSGDYPFPPLELTAPARRIFDAAPRSGFTRSSSRSRSTTGPREPRCINCFTCDGFPCRIGAKNDMTQTALKKADPAGSPSWPARTCAPAFESDGRIVGLEAIDRDGGRRLKLSARAYILSAGALGTPALMLRSDLAPARSFGRARPEPDAALQRDGRLRVPVSNQPRGGQSQADLHHRSLRVGARAATGPRWGSSRTCACRRARWSGRSARPGSAGRPPSPPTASRRCSASPRTSRAPKIGSTLAPIASTPPGFRSRR